MEETMKYPTPKSHPIYKFVGRGADDEFIKNLLIARRFYLSGEYKEELDYFFDKLRLEYKNK